MEAVAKVMWKWFIVSLAMLCTMPSFADQASQHALLDNRFRVDPSITQITFVVYREEASKPVVLVRPDGRKYYSTRFPDNVRWYQEAGMDIISIEHPMPGPWQAIGKITPENKVQLISHLQLTTDILPHVLYQNEVIKFTARLTSNDQPLLLRDFLDRVNLKITFTHYIENEAELIKEAKPVPVVVGEFADDGLALDEKAGDGVFTLALPVTVEPGKYRVRITSGNGVFLRAQEQTVLVYPSPIMTTFIQSRETGQPHQIVITGEDGLLMAGSLAAQITQDNPDWTQSLATGQAEPDSMKVKLTLDYQGKLGNYAWTGTVYATDQSTSRPLVFPLTEQTYSVANSIDLATTWKIQQEEQERRQQQAQQELIQQMQQKKRQQTMLLIGVGNVLVLIVSLLAWWGINKRRAKRAVILSEQGDQGKATRQLTMPKR